MLVVLDLNWEAGMFSIMRLIPGRRPKFFLKAPSSWFNLILASVFFGTVCFGCVIGNNFQLYLGFRPIKVKIFKERFEVVCLLFQLDIEGIIHLVNLLLIHIVNK